MKTEDIKNHMSELLEQFEIVEYANMKIKELSKGNKQKIKFIIALALLLSGFTVTSGISETAGVLYDAIAIRVKNKIPMNKIRYTNLLLVNA